MDIRFARILQVLCFFCFVLAQVSPACAFVSGKGDFLEICAADGSLKTIKVAGAFDPLDDKESQHSTKSECAFCFAQAHIAKIPVDVAVLFQAMPSNYIGLSAGMITPRTLSLSQGQPRAPPAHS